VQRASSVPIPSALSPEQQHALRQSMKAEQLGQQGKSRSEGANARAVLNLDNMRKPESPFRHLSYDKQVKLVAAVEFTQPNFIRDIHHRAAANESLAPAVVERVTRDNPAHAQYGAFGPPLAVETFLFQHVAEAAKDNLYTSLSTLQGEVFAATGKEIKRETLRCWLHAMKIKHGEKKLSGLTHPYANVLIRKYIFEYAQLLRREQKGEIVLVWMDESYIHAGYCSSFGWYIDQPGAVVQNRVRGKEKGKRIIIMHAMSRFGMIEVPIDAGKLSDDLGVALPTAAIVSTVLSSDGKFEDYHDTMDGDKFIAWIRNRLIPAFKAKFGKKKKMCLILDNAKYHHARGEDWMTPSGMNGGQLADALRQLRIPSITNGIHRWPSKCYSMLQRGSPPNGAPTLGLMREVLSEYLKSHPGINTTVVQQMMEAEKHELLYTPPYESWLQPIELVWARVKHTVAMQSRRDRKYQETQQQTRAALSAISSELCASLTGHTEKLMSEWLRSPDAGSLGRWQSLAELVSAEHEVVGKGADLAAENVDPKQARTAQLASSAAGAWQADSDSAAEEEEEEKKPAKKSRQGERRSARLSRP
jgi:hypothetical protein